MNNQSSKKSKTKIIVIALCVVAGLAIIGYATGSSNNNQSKTKTEQSLVSQSLISQESKSESDEAKEKALKYAEMVKIDSCTCKRNSEGIPEITIVYDFYNNTDQTISFGRKFHDIVKHEFKECFCLRADDNFEKELKVGERIKTSVVYQGNGTITGFLEITLQDLSGKETYLWKTYTLE